MVISDEKGRAEGVVYSEEEGGNHSQSEFSLSRQQYGQEHTSLSFLAYLGDTVPMVALECELPLSGRLSPPSDVAMSIPFLPSLSSGSRRTEEEGQLCSPEPSAGLLANARAGCKRKLSRPLDSGYGEDQVKSADPSSVICCFEEDEDVTCGRQGEECGEQSLPKRRRYQDDGDDFPETNVSGRVVENETVERVEEVSIISSTLTTCDSVNTEVIADSRNHVAAATESEQSLCMNVVDSSDCCFVSEDSDDGVLAEADSIVEVDVVGDDSVGDFRYNASSHRDLQQTIAEAKHFAETLTDEATDDTFSYMPHRPARISPFLNTPKQRKEERRKILKLSIHKMRAVEDPEHFLRRSVLINNTMKRLQRELREEKMRSSPRKGCYGLYRRASALHYDVLNNSYLLHDEPFAVSENDRITDDMTDALVTRLEATSSIVVPTPSPSPSPRDEPDTSGMEFPTSSSELLSHSTACSLDDVSYTVGESVVSSLSPDLTSSTSEHSPTSQSPDHIFHPASIPTLPEQEVSITTTCAAELASPISSSTSPSSLPYSPPSSCSCILYEGVFGVPAVGRDPQTSSGSSSCSSESQREKQLYADIDTVFNNLIHALGDS